MGIDATELKNLLSRIDANLEEPGTICLIGSGATLLLGQGARQTEDVDIWDQATTISQEKLGQACGAAGLTFDPKDEYPEVPYVQLVHPGIVQVPGWEPMARSWLGEPERVVWQGMKLTVTVPPPSIIAASKLVRGEPQDLEDCLWLMAAHEVEAHAVMTAIRGMPRRSREQAQDNLDLLKLMRM